MSKRAYLVTVLVTRRVVADTKKEVRFCQAILNKPKNPGIFDHLLGKVLVDNTGEDGFGLDDALKEAAPRFAEDLSENIVAIRPDDEIPYERGE